MVARAVRAVLDTGLVGLVELLGPPGRADALAAACAGLPVRLRAGGAGLLAPDAARADDGRVVLWHEAARPLAPAALVAAVLAAVRGGGQVAVPVLPMTDTVKQVDPAGLVVSTPDRSGLRVVQTPLAARAELWAEPGPRWEQRLRGWFADGVAVHTVPGHPLAFPVRSAWDLELAGLLAEQGGSDG